MNENENETPSHDEALEALAKIRAAVRAADLADLVAWKAKLAYKEAKKAAEHFGHLARDTSRAMTRPLPLFDEADGMTPGEVPNEPRADVAGSLPPPAKKSRKDVAKEAINAQFAPGRFGQHTPISELTIPEEVADALKAMGFSTVGMLLAFRDNDCAWTIVPGIDEAGAARLDRALSDAAAKAMGLNLPAESESGEDAGRDAA